jgi:hypothetical protein
VTNQERTGDWPVPGEGQGSPARMFPYMPPAPYTGYAQETCPVAGSAIQTINPGISRVEWFAGQLIASGQFALARLDGTMNEHVVARIFDHAEKLAAEADRRKSGHAVDPNTR